MLEAQRQAILAEMRVGVRQPEDERGPKLGPWGDVLLKAFQLGPNEAIIASYTGICEIPGESRTTRAQVDDADVRVENVHHFPQRVRAHGGPGFAPSMSGPMMTCADTGNYPTIEKHAASATPRYRPTGGGVLTEYEIVNNPKE